MSYLIFKVGEDRFYDFQELFVQNHKVKIIGILKSFKLFSNLNERVKKINLILDFIKIKY